MKFDLSANIYQGRDMQPADDNGLADPYVKICIGGVASESAVLVPQFRASNGLGTQALVLLYAFRTNTTAAQAPVVAHGAAVRLCTIGGGMGECPS